MRFAVSLPLSGAGGDVRKAVDLAVMAEEHGWDGVFVEDYIVYLGAKTPPTFDPFTMLAVIAARTKRIRFGTTVTPLPRRRPWKVAREGMTLDQLSGGRFILGVGLGDVNDRGAAAFGEETDVTRRAGMVDEALQIITGLWTGREFWFTGEYYNVAPVTFLPKPIGIPIWIGGVYPRRGVLARAARYDGACLYKLRPDGIGEMLTPEDVRAVRKITRKKQIRHRGRRHHARQRPGARPRAHPTTRGSRRNLVVRIRRRLQRHCPDPAHQAGPASGFQAGTLSASNR